ncbi:hypothetical protein [Herpetosiphon geysericola]|uniref:Uncharacterized protein n=1 Tax=Herpetosiphon geysericola TaxID=70996 RepID=A0A0P6YK70_9CHLR|nr:hypothetical protein [Herpetosiphon geysericola]KPL85579.1 hypothetical protein SE18_18385 [Herpetosiphon geysericola]
MNQEVVDRIPFEIQQRIVYDFLLLREDIQPSISVLVSYRKLLQVAPATITPDNCQQFMQSIDQAIEQLEWCYQT